MHTCFHPEIEEGASCLSEQEAVHVSRVLRMKPGDIFFLADFRRYQPILTTFAKKATIDRKAQVVLMTDKWLSPANRYASEVLAVPIDTGTIWDSYSAALAVTEALVTRVAEENWDNTKARIEAWDIARQNSTEADL